VFCSLTSDESRRCIRAFPVCGVNHTEEAEEEREPDDSASRHGGDLAVVLGGELFAGLKVFLTVSLFLLQLQPSIPLPFLLRPKVDSRDFWIAAFLEAR